MCTPLSQATPRVRSLVTLFVPFIEGVGARGGRERERAGWPSVHQSLYIFFSSRTFVSSRPLEDDGMEVCAGWCRHDGGGWGWVCLVVISTRSPCRLLRPSPNSEGHHAGWDSTRRGRPSFLPPLLVGTLRRAAGVLNIVAHRR